MFKRSRIGFRHAAGWFARVIGYKNSTKIAKEALETGKGVYELVLEHNILSKKDLDTILEPENMIKPVKLDIHPNR